MAEEGREERAIARPGGSALEAQHDVAARYWAAKGAGGPVVGGDFVPRESYNLMRMFKVMDYDVAQFWAYAHSWGGNFGLTGALAEGEDPRVRALVTEATPAIVLVELHSVATFNMLDPVIGADIGAVQDTLSECLMHRSRHNQGYPLGYVLQGAGPHFCPGGNHHPVNPPGATNFSMSTHVSSLWNVRFREHAIPGITAISGSAVGGGVAIAVNTTQRVAASNASMAFGNLSRGASPLMWLSANLVSEVGMATAVNLYLTDGTVSAYGGLKAGLVMGVSPTIATTKTRAMMLSKAIAGASSARLVCHQLIDLNTHRFDQECTGFTFNVRNGSMFANVSGKSTKAKQGAAAETAEPLHTKKPLAWSSAGKHSAGQPGGASLPGAEGQASNREARRTPSKQGQPRPFPERIGTQPIHVSCCDTPCVQCGGRGMDGTIYGDTYYCEACWPRMGLNMAAGAPGQEPDSPSAQGLPQADGHAQPSAIDAGRAPPRARTKCAACGVAAHKGQWGFGVYGSDFYCSGCWRSWRGSARGSDRGAGFFTDVSTDYTDNDYDSGTDGTIINSDCVTATDGSDME